MTTQTDVVAAVQTALDTAQDFAGVPRTSAQITALQAQVAQLTTDRDAQKARADKAEARFAQLNTDIDAVQAKD